jgi:hypothetical protein
VTVPEIFVSRVRSNMAPEWCTQAGLASTSMTTVRATTTADLIWKLLVGINASMER